MEEITQIFYYEIRGSLLDAALEVKSVLVSGRSDERGEYEIRRKGGTLRYETVEVFHR